VIGAKAPIISLACIAKKRCCAAGKVDAGTRRAAALLRPRPEHQLGCGRTGSALARSAPWPAAAPASLGVWRWAQRRLRQPAPSPPPACLLDASVLRERLRLDAELALEASHHWWQIGQRLEAVRFLASACAELDPGCAVALMVLLERLVQRALALEDHLCRLSRAPTPGSLLLLERRLDALQEHLQRCQEALTRCYEAAMEESLRCPDVPATVVLYPLLLNP